MQSQKQGSKQKKPTPLSLPHGWGSMHFKGASWQLTWRDAAGNIQYVGSNTADAREAQKLLAQLALPRAEAMVAQLRRIASGEETYQGDDKAGATARRPKARRSAKAAGGNRQAGKEGTR